MTRWYAEIYASMLADPLLILCWLGVAVLGGTVAGVVFIYWWYNGWRL